MKITFADNRDMRCYEEFVNNPTDRTCRRKFCKVFSDEIAEEAVKRHDLLKRFPSALAYNQIYGASDNRIELKRGVADKDNLILKVRVSRSYRKFFNMVIQEDPLSFLLKEGWKGQFNEITHIYVTDVNKHDYN